MRMRKPRLEDYPIGALLTPLRDNIPMMRSMHDYVPRCIRYWKEDEVGIVLGPSIDRYIQVLVGESMGWVAMDLTRMDGETDEDIYRDV